MVVKEQTFKKQFIFRDEDHVNRSIELYYHPPLRVFNSILKQIEQRLGRALSLEEKISISQNRSEGLLMIYRPQYQFPKADDSFNLQALGVNINDLLEDLDKFGGLPEKLAEKNGEMVLSDEFINEMMEGSTQYTENENQNKAYALAKKFVKMLDEAKDLGLLSELELSIVQQRLVFLERERGVLIPNRHVLRGIK